MPPRALIWPLLDKLRPPTAYQRRPKALANAPVQRIPVIPYVLPTPNFLPSGKEPAMWDVAPSALGLAALRIPSVPLTALKTNPRTLTSRVKPSVIRPFIPARIAMIGGVTRDSSGAILGSCVVELYETATNIALAQTTSDATTGAYNFTCARYSPITHYIVAYKAGSPDVAGTTVNTLTGA